MWFRLAVFGFWIVAGTSAWGVPLDGPALRSALNQEIDQHPTSHRTTVTLKVIDLKSGEVLFDRGGDRLMTPASNLKIYTSACALDTFGPDHQFVTKLHATGKIGGGTLHGNLILVGGGDAMLTSVDLAKLATRVVEEWGIRRVEGKVIVDNSRYFPTLKGPGWMWDDELYYFNMRVTPLMVDFNTVAVRGSVDEYGKEKRVAIDDPQAFFATVFSRMLGARNVEIEPPHAKMPTETVQTLTYEGVNLAETLRHFNHKSENAVGEVLLHEIAIAKGKVKPNWSDGAEAITAWLHNTAGLERGSFRLVDGSGLSRYNLISADSSIRLLTFMRQHRHGQVFFDALPVKEFSPKNIDWPTPVVGHNWVVAKTGGMSGVSTISGYLRTIDGRQLVFSMLTSGFIGSKDPVFDLRDRLWTLLVQYRDTRGE